ncbi:MAG: hypothetical protein H0X54_02925 [Propionibacteriales bacterium]|nr:hypothetical protein [Propionibacteriales bacterium]
MEHPPDIGYWCLVVSATLRNYQGVNVFFFFSNRLGCLGSLLLSVAVTVVLIVIFTG